MHKRGISGIVATVLNILIIVAAVTLLWTAVLPMIKNSGYNAESAEISILSSKGYIGYDSIREFAIVQIQRGQDKANLSAIRVIFSFAGTTEFAKVSPVEKNSAKTYTFNLRGFGFPTKVSIAPIYIINGKSKEGEVVSELSFGRQNDSAYNID